MAGQQLGISTYARRLQHTAKVESAPSRAPAQPSLAATPLTRTHARAENAAIREIDEVLAALEEFDDAAEASGCAAREAVLGAGDLPDDFVLEAAQAALPEASAVVGEEEEEWDLESVSAGDKSDDEER